MTRFADGIVIITENKGNIQSSIDEMEKILGTFKMKINEKNIYVNIYIGVRSSIK